MLHKQMSYHQQNVHKMNEMALNINCFFIIYGSNKSWNRCYTQYAEQNEMQSIYHLCDTNIHWQRIPGIFGYIMYLLKPAHHIFIASWKSPANVTLVYPWVFFFTIKANTFYCNQNHSKVITTKLSAYHNSWFVMGCVMVRSQSENDLQEYRISIWLKLCMKNH